MPLFVASTGSAGPSWIVPSPADRFCKDEDGVAARSPVLRMIEPSDLERMRVDWTPGFDARRDKFSKVDVC